MCTWGQGSAFDKYHCIEISLYQFIFDPIFFFWICLTYARYTIQFFWIVSVRSWSDTIFLDCIRLLLIRYKILLLYQCGSRSDTKILDCIETDIYRKYQCWFRFVLVGRGLAAPVSGANFQSELGGRQPQAKSTHPKYPIPRKYKRDNQSVFNEFSWNF